MALNPKCPLFPQVLFIPIKEIGIQGTLGTWGHSYRVVSPMSTSRGQGTSGDNVHNDIRGQCPQCPLCPLPPNDDNIK
jgi:hypothetical protein